MRLNIRHNFLLPITLALVCSLVSFGDYAWIPDYHHLQTKVGIDYLHSSDNFGSDGVKTALTNANQPTSLNDFKFWIEGEYGFVKDWSGYLRLPFTTALIDNSTETLFSGSGFSDLNLGLKWNVLRSKSLITLELFSRVPLYSTTAPQTGELVLGDGSFDFGGLMNVGYRFNRRFAVGISPGLMIRSSGYESAFVGSAFGGATFHPMYIRLVIDSLFSLRKPSPTITNSSNSKTGSGGSFARLSKNPDSVAIGVRIGAFLSKQYRLEASTMWSTYGKSSPVYFKTGLNLVADFDLYEPELPKTKVKEIPFEKEQQPLDRSKESQEFGAPTENFEEKTN